MSSKGLSTTRSLGPTAPSWEHKVCIPLVVSCGVQVLTKDEAHCAWIQTCRCLSLGKGGRDAESVLDPTGFRQLLNYLYKVRESLSVQDTSLTPHDRGTRCPSSTSSFPEISGKC